MCSLFHSPVSSSLLSLNIFLSTLFSNTFSLRSSPQKTYTWKLELPTLIPQHPISNTFSLRSSPQKTYKWKLELPTLITFEKRSPTSCCQWLCTDGTTLDGWRIYSWSCYLDEDLPLRYYNPTNRTRYKTKHVFDVTLNANWKPRKRLGIHFTRWHLALHHRQWKVSRKYAKTVFLNRRAAAQYRALESITPDRERFSWNLSF